MNLKERTVRGVAWASIDNWGRQLLSFAVYTGLARLLDPKSFGLVALAGIYVYLVQIFVDQGLGTVLVQRQELEREHLDSSFWISIAVSGLFFLLSSLLADPLAELFHEPRVAPVIRWLSLLFVIYALSSVPKATLTRNLEFKALAIRSLVSTAAGGVVGLSMAFRGWGAWSLVGQQLTAAVVGMFCLFWATPWRPRLAFSGKHLRDLYRFALSVLGSDSLYFVAQRTDQTLVGYGFGATALGPYSLASRLTQLLMDAVAAPLQLVALPALSRLQSERSQMHKTFLRFCEVGATVGFPAFTGVALLAPEFVPTIFGKQWTGAITIIEILAFFAALRLAITFFHPLWLASGRPGLYLVIFVAQTLVNLLACLFAIRWNPVAVAVAVLVTMAIHCSVFIVMSRRVLKISALRFLGVFRVPVAGCLVMATVVLSVKAVYGDDLSPIVIMLLSIFLGAAVYIGTVAILRPDLVREVIEMLASRWKGLDAYLGRT